MPLPALFGRRGFTLVEVVMSLAIIAVLLPVILYATSLAARGASLARNRTRAAALAQQKLDELMVVGPLQNGNGDFTDQGTPGFTWTSQLINRDDIPTVDNLTTSLEEFDVTVTWKQDGQPRDLMLSTLIYQNSNTQNSSTTGGATP